MGLISGIVRRGAVATLRRGAEAALKGAPRAAMAGLAAGKFAMDHPLLTTVAALGVYGVWNYDSPENQSIPAGPASVQARPGGLSNKSSFDMGASGDLVFALHRLNH